MNTRAVVLLSGGLDSSTTCAVARSKGRDVYALTLDYDQRNLWEINAAKAVAKANGVKEHLIFPVAMGLFGGSSLTDKSIEVDKSATLDEIGRAIPNSYVPARNTIFLSLALAYAETRKATEIWLGINSVDYSGYPDCRPEYLKAFSKLATLATKASVEGAALEIKAPLLNLDKAGIIKLGVSLGVDYSLTRTCYDLDDQGRACGKCEACQLRRKGFREAGVPDPTPYR